MSIGLLPVTASAANYSYPTLKENISGKANEVTALKYLLKSYGYYTATINGSFDANTTKAVKSFQTAKKLSPVDGIVGSGTWSALVAERTVKSGANADAIRAVQYLLKNKFGFSSIVVDGAYGPASKSTVHRFQRALSGSSLITTVDGIVGSTTWGNLLGATKAQADISAYWYIYIVFPSDRTKTGTLYLYDSTGASKLSMACKGLGTNRSENGNHRERWWLEFANTPLVCASASLSSSPDSDKASYGPYRIVKLDSGNVGTATKAAGGIARNGIWIHSHGNDLALSSSSAKTLGCILLSQANHKALADNVAKLGTNGFVIICEQ